MQLGYKNAFVLADGAKFYFKFTRRYIANLLNLYAQLNKFHSKFYAVEHVSTFASQNISQMYPPRAVKTRLHKTPRTKQLVAPLTIHRFLACDGYSRCKSVAANDCNTPLLAFSARQTFHSCTRTRQASLWQLFLFVQSQDVSYRRGAI